MKKIFTLFVALFGVAFTAFTQINYAPQVKIFSNDTLVFDDKPVILTGHLLPPVAWDQNVSYIWEYKTSSNDWTNLQKDSSAFIVNTFPEPWRTYRLNAIERSDNMMALKDSLYISNEIKITKSNVLPVNLKSFTGIKKTNGIELRWESYAEINTDHFEIERSENGKDFALINKNIKINPSKVYQVNDGVTLQNGKNIYYRLRVVDRDGSIALSHTIHIALDGSALIRMYPNPTADILNIDLPGNLNIDPTNTKVFIYNESGQLKIAQNIGNGPVNISFLPTGNYVIKITDGKNIFLNSKFIKK